ncbi:MAG: hypothetical protein HQL87_11210 [Magnetococcales bacterium]|nr:hypothetical protein [Magnetococcales bacterium]
MVEILMHAVDSHAELHLSFGRKVLEYKTHFLAERETESDQSGALSSEYLRDKAYLRIGPTDSPEGDARIRTGQMATFSFVQGNSVNEFTSCLRSEEGVTTGGGKGPADSRARAFKMVFPDQIARKPLQRDTIRAANSATTGVTLQVECEEGAHFAATLLDISTGGCSFILPYDETPVSVESLMTLVFSWGEENQVTQHGTLFKIETRQGNVIVHIGFCCGTYRSMQEIGELVTHIECINLRIRHHLAPTETENLSELYRPTSSSSADDLDACASRIRTS